MTLFAKLDHHIRDFDILFCLVLSGHLEDDVLLVIRNWLLADMLHELAHAMIYHVSGLIVYMVVRGLTEEEGDPSPSREGRSLHTTN